MRINTIKYKIGLLVTLVTLVGVVFPARVLAGEGTLYLTPATIQATKGKSYSLEAKIDTSAPINGAGFELTYDQKVLKLAGIDDTGTDFDYTLEQNISEGKIRLIRSTTGQTKTGNLKITSLSFQAIGTGTTVLNMAGNAAKYDEYTEPAVRGSTIVIAAPVTKQPTKPSDPAATPSQPSSEPTQPADTPDDKQEENPTTEAPSQPEVVGTTLKADDKVMSKIPKKTRAGTFAIPLLTGLVLVGLLLLHRRALAIEQGGVTTTVITSDQGYVPQNINPATGLPFDMSPPPAQTSTTPLAAPTEPSVPEQASLAPDTPVPAPLPTQAPEPTQLPAVEPGVPQHPSDNNPRT